jgi:hypothetical protein
MIGGAKTTNTTKTNKNNQNHQKPLNLIDIEGNGRECPRETLPKTTKTTKTSKNTKKHTKTIKQTSKSDGNQRK